MESSMLMNIYRIAVCGLLLLAPACGRVPLLNKFIDGDTLPEQVSGADIVVIGKMVTLEARALIEEEFIYSYGTRYIYFDVAGLEVIDVLKGDYDKETIHVKFLSFDQTQPPPHDEVDCDFFSYHNIWDPGIWLIEIRTGREPKYYVRRGNYIPMNRLPEVRKSLRESNAAER
jgi:hypothetical protein